MNPWTPIEVDLPPLGVEVYVVLDYNHGTGTGRTNFRCIDTRYRFKSDEMFDSDWKWSQGTNRPIVTHWCPKEDLLP